MSTGLSAFIIFLFVAIVIISFMVILASTTRGAPLDQAPITRSGYAIRRWWFRALLTGVVIAFAFSIPSFPYPSAREIREGSHFAIVAQQYGFRMPTAVPANTPVVFDVSSADVNHGFAIFDPEHRLIGQVQAMPGYTNHLYLVFRERGHYLIRCLEFCGVGHAYMQATFEVR